MCESGMTIAGIRLEFEPAHARDAIPIRDRPRPLEVFVLFHVPPRIEDLLAVLHAMHLTSALLDTKRLPTILGFPKLAYVHCAFWLKDAASLFANPKRLMNKLHNLARMARAHEAAASAARQWEGGYG
ncbi:hypothetical protein GGF32_004440 [Allomyces javanicus]|nr:hypothetical protein GGF32_004440 [Allomyces javanicus]